MKRAVLAAILALFGFYGAWPAWTGYRIRQAIADQNAELLESKIDFPSVRQSMKPVVVAEIERTIEANPLAAVIVGQNRDVSGRLADRAIETVITAPNLIRIVREGRDIKRTVERVLIEQIGGARSEGGPRGALGSIAERLGQRRQGGAQPQPQPPAEEKPDTGPAEGPPRRFGLANVKRVGLLGPLAFEVAVARDPAAAEPDMTAQLRFTGGDWKVVSLVPRQLRR